MTGTIGERFGERRRRGLRAAIALGVAVLMMTAGVSPALADEVPPAADPVATSPSDPASAAVPPVESPAPSPSPTLPESTPTPEPTTSPDPAPRSATTAPIAKRAKQAASAAATAPTLDLVATITDANGVPISSVVPSATTSVEYQVRASYTCSGDTACTNVKVSIAAPRVDPYYGTNRKESSATWIPPYSPAPPITGTLATGFTVTLGTVNPGAGGTIVFRYFIKGPSSTPGSQVRDVTGWGNFFPPGFPIDPLVTITASNAPTVTDSDSATYDSIIPQPTMTFTAPASVKTDTPITLGMNAFSGCWFENSWPTFKSLYNSLCSTSGSVAVKLPPKAVWVPGSGGTYDAVTNTVTVTAGPNAWQGLRTGAFQVIFPSSAYPTSGPGCYAAEPFLGTGSVTYLNGTVKATSPASIPLNMTVDNCTPFMKGTFNKSATAASYKIPTTTPTTGPYWIIDTYHQGNKPGVMTVVDNQLDQPGMPVYQINTSLHATIQYTLDDNTTGSVTGFSYVAPAGRHIIKVTVVSDPLAGPNLDPSGTASTRFYMYFYFSILPGATPGPRTNTASATITYPDFPTVPAFTPTGSPDSQTITLFNVTPFAKASTDKYSNAASYAINATTTNAAGNWVIDTCNQGNVDGFATVTDTFNQAGMPVYRIITNVSATTSYTLDNGATGSFTGTDFSAPAGRSFASISVVSSTLAGPNTVATGTVCTLFRVSPYFSVLAGATPGNRTNTAAATMTYPNSSLGTITASNSPDSQTISLFTNTPYTLTVTPLAPTNTTSPGVSPRAGDEVLWKGTGKFCNLATDKTITPQYVFLAPVGWNVLAGGGSLGGVPGATFTYKTVTYAGTAYSAVIVQWPATVAGVGTGSGTNCVTLSQLSVKTTPTLAATLGAQTGYWFFGDAAGAAAEAYVGTEVDEATTGSDIDGDGSTTDSFALTPTATTLQGVPGLDVRKAICQPDPTQSDGCNWISDPAITVGVPPTATSIKYRVTIMNTGQTVLSNVVATDVLPYVGDPRGSTVKEQLATLTQDSPTGMTMDYSTSTSPSASSWTAPLAGASAIRATLASMPAQTSRTFIFEAALVGGSADQTACNSVSITAATMGTSEPPRVCASTQEADFEITTANRLPLQASRIGVVPFTVTNHGGSAVASGIVTLTVPAELNVESLIVPGWVCTAGALTGPTQVSCRPVQADGSTTRELVKDVAETIPLKVRPTASAPATLCVGGDVQSAKFDPVSTNNTTTSCASVITGPALALTKDDGKTTVGVGDTYTYTITVTNRLVAESVANATVTDTLPAGLQLVSTSPSATVSGQTLTWNLGALGQAGVLSPSGTVSTGGAGSTTSVTVTVKVLPTATGTIDNTARVSAPDPATPASTLAAQATDSDGLQRLSITKSSNAAAAGVRAGDVVTYTVTLANDGTTDYTALNPARLVDDLSGVLDDATFVSGSAAASVNGAAPSAVADPTGQQLKWSGALTGGSSVSVTYQVTVGVGTTGAALVNTAYAAATPTSCASGLTPANISCATVTTQFAPTLAKVVTSSVQNSDGTWTTVYSVVVTNVSTTTAATYTLSDALAFGAGISVLSAAITSAPAGVTTAAWTGSGAVATSISLPPSSQHIYQLTVVADAGTVGGTPAALCTTGVAGGFANRASLTTTDGRHATAEACAAPVEPTIKKTVATPVQLPDGRWSIVYTVTVSNSNPTPASLAYTVRDALNIPAGITTDAVTVSGPAGAPMNGAFNGSSDTALLSAADRIPSGTTAAPATRVYTVTVVVDAPSGAGTPAALACAPAGSGGYLNTATLTAGTSATALDSATACANATPQPTPQITKTVVSSAVDAGGLWTLVYDIAVVNPDTQYSTFYSLTDALGFAPGATVVSAHVASSDATTAAAWDGVNNLAVSTNVALPAASIHHYTVTVVADPSSVDPQSALADCRVDAGETGTGFRNVATVTSGISSVFSAACEPFTDPSVVKTVTAAPSQDPATGIWTMKYTITVSNRSQTTVGTIPYSLTDTLGFPAGVHVTDVTATAHAGGTVNGGFDGISDTHLGSGAIGAAQDAATPATQVYDLTVSFTIPAGISSGAACDPSQGPGGLRNEAEVVVGARVSGSVACADLPDVPLPGLTKSVISQQQLADGTWELLYRLTVANPSGTAASVYTLDDEMALGAGMTVVGDPTIVAHPAGVTVDPSFDGAGDSTVSQNILLPAGGSHTYTVRAVVDAGSVTGQDPAGNCTFEAGESGTGFANFATLDSGVATADAQACAQVWDPGVTKQLNGQPVQQPDGSWLLSYTMTVTNPSNVQLAYGLVDALSFPVGTQTTIESAASRPGGPTVEANWDGETHTQLVADGTPLAPNAVHVFDVTVRAVLPATQQPAAGGWANTATVESGTGNAVATAVTAAADVRVPRLTVDKTVTTTDPVIRMGDQVSYHLVVTNTGDGDFTNLFPAVVRDDLSNVLDDANLTSAPVVTPSTGTVTDTGNGFHWLGALTADRVVTIDYTVTAHRGGNADLVNTAYQAQPLDADPAPPSTCGAPTCVTTDTPMPALFIQKSVSVDKVAPGGAVVYTVTVTNTGKVDIPDGDPATATDDMTGVLNNASYRGDVKASTGNATISGSTLSWSGGLATGQTATITYSVTVHATVATGAKLINTAVSDPTLAAVDPVGEPNDGRATTTTLVVLLAYTGIDTFPGGIGLAGVLIILGTLTLGLVARRRRRLS